MQDEQLKQLRWPAGPRRRRHSRRQGRHEGDRPEPAHRDHDPRPVVEPPTRASQPEPPRLRTPNTPIAEGVRLQLRAHLDV